MCEQWDKAGPHVSITCWIDHFASVHRSLFTSSGSSTERPVGYLVVCWVLSCDDRLRNAVEVDPDEYVVGSDYVFPRTANTIIKEQLKAKGGETVGEDYLPLGNTEVTPIITKIKQALPDGGVIFNTLNGDSNVAFFKQLQAAGLTPDKYPVMSVSVAEEEVKQIGKEYLLGQYACWNYFQTVDTPANKKFVAAFRAKYGEDRVTNDPMEAAYIMVYLWKQAVEQAATADDLDKVRAAAVGQKFDAPEGPVEMFPNHHISKTVRIGQVRDDGLFNIVWSTPGVVDPQPWNQFVPETKGFACDWTDPAKGGKFKMEKS